MAARRRRRVSLRTRRELRQWAAISGGSLLLLTLVWQTSAMVLVVVLGSVGLGAVGCWLWRAHRVARAGERAFRLDEEHRANALSMAAVDQLTWQQFEHHVADLCRRDGCTRVVVSGRSGDLGADVTGYLPDGRRLVVQCKHYAAHRYVPSGDMQKFVGTAKLHHRAEVALFVATCRFGRAARDLAVSQGIFAMERDLLGSWNRGAPLESLLPLNGRGGGTARPGRRARPGG